MYNIGSNIQINTLNGPLYGIITNYDKGFVEIIVEGGLTYSIAIVLLDFDIVIDNTPDFEQSRDYEYLSVPIITYHNFNTALNYFDERRDEFEFITVKNPFYEDSLNYA